MRWISTLPWSPLPTWPNPTELKFHTDVYNQIAPVFSFEKWTGKNEHFPLDSQNHQFPERRWETSFSAWKHGIRNAIHSLFLCSFLLLVSGSHRSLNSEIFSRQSIRASLWSSRQNVSRVNSREKLFPGEVAKKKRLEHPSLSGPWNEDLRPGAGTAGEKGSTGS